MTQGCEQCGRPDAARSLAAGAYLCSDCITGAVRLDVLSAAALCALPDPPKSQELVGPLLGRGARLVLGGHTGEGKTTLSLQMVRAVAFGGSFLDWQAAQGKVLVIDAEQGLKTIKRRLREAGLDRSDDVDYLRAPDGLALDSNDQEAADLEAVLDEGGYALVLADPLYKLHRGDSNSEREAVDLMRRFDRWRERYGFGLVLPAHCRKPQQNGAKFTMHEFFGQSAYLRGAEVVLGLQRLNDGYSKLWFFKDRDGDLPIGDSWGLLFDREHGFRRAPEDCEPAKTRTERADDLRERVFEYVRSHGPVLRTQVYAGVRKPNGRGYRQERVRETLDGLESDGLVNETSEGFRAIPSAGIAAGYPPPGTSDGAIPARYPPEGGSAPDSSRSPLSEPSGYAIPHPAVVSDEDYEAERQRVLDKFPDAGGAS